MAPKLLIGACAMALLCGAAPALACTPGTWTTVEVDKNEPVQYQTDHFAFRWKPGTVDRTDAVNAGKQLELIWSVYMGPVGFTEPYCDTADKHKANINLDPTFGLSGGPTGDRDMGMWIGPLALRDHWGLAHEFAHALQGSTRGLRDGDYVGWLWEDHANWMAHQMPEFHTSEVHCSEMLVDYPHLYYGSTRDRYCSWQFLEYVKDQYGYEAVNDIWLKAKKPTDPGYLEEDPFSILQRNMGWTTAELNQILAEWALHNVNWDYTNPNDSDEGALYRAKYGPIDDTNPADRRLRLTRLDPIDLAHHRFAVPFSWAPQRWGYNVVKLIPDAGATKIDVSFEGIVQAASAVKTLPGLKNEPKTIPAPASGWWWGVVVIDAQGQSRLTPVVGGADGEMIVPLKTGDKAVYLVVMGAPDEVQKIKWDQAYYSIYRYPWMVQLTGASPDGFEPNAPTPTRDGHRHANGGGWVAAGAHVDDSAYVGPYAEVLGGTVSGRARIEDHAVVLNGTVRDDATVGALTVVDGGVVIKHHAVVATTFKGPGAFERGAVIGGTAQLRGDVELRDGFTLTKGVYYGFVDKGVAADPAQGADLTAPVPEVTAVPDYHWRPQE